MSERLRVLIASYLEPEHVERIRGVDPRLDVAYEPSLLRRPRYPADHNGEPAQRSHEDETRWRALLANADVLFDFDYTNDEALPDLAPQVRWIQATSAGIGPFVKRRNYPQRMPRTVFTNAVGVHAGPLAEFCALAMLAWSRGLFSMLDQQRRSEWTRFAGTELPGRTVVIFGCGSIGREVARVSRALGMKTIGLRRSIEGLRAADMNLDELLSAGALREVLPRAEFLVLCAPHTPETEGRFGRAELALMPRGAMLINIARGALVDEAALVAALRNGPLSSAALDVFREEPLPSSSPFWSMPNVLVSPHSASTSDRENGRITDLFCENLRRFLGGRPLRNLLDTKQL